MLQGVRLGVSESESGKKALVPCQALALTASGTATPRSTRSHLQAQSVPVQWHPASDSEFKSEVASESSATVTLKAEPDSESECTA